MPVACRCSSSSLAANFLLRGGAVTGSHHVATAASATGSVGIEGGITRSARRSPRSPGDG